MSSSRRLPEDLNAQFKLIEMIVDEGLDSRHFKEIHSLSFKDIIQHHTGNEGIEQHSFAGWARACGRQKVLDFLYKKPRHDFYDQRINLHWAILCNQGESEIKRIIDAHHESDPRDEKPEVMPNPYGYTALHIAALEDDLDALRLLLKETNLVDYNRYDNQETALHVAARFGHLKAAAELLNAGINAEVRDRDGNTAMHVILENRKDIAPEFIDMLATHRKGFNINLANKKGYTPVHLWLQGDDKEAPYAESDVKGNGNLKVFYKFGQRIGTNVMANNGHTPLTLAALGGHINALNLLMRNEHFTHELASDENIQLAFLKVCEAGKIAAFDVLLPLIDIKPECTEETSSALYKAASHGQLDIVRALLVARIAQDISDREDQEEEYKKHTYFFVKKGAGYSKTQKLAASRALLNVVSEGADKDSLKEHLKVLNNGSLKELYQLVDKYLFNEHKPAIVREQREYRGGGAGFQMPRRYQGDFGHIAMGLDAVGCMANCSTHGGCTIL